ncbi:MAG: ankyrin repeat domain-containing protein [Pyrinomonadaceae bacterium]|nr:ankyrin repeat domain-containing protein [Pyrinomonadaceae bacterium]
MRRLLKAIMLAVLLQLSVQAIQETEKEYSYTVQGRIVDGHGSPVAGADITFEPSGGGGCVTLSYKSDEDGWFYISGIASTPNLEWVLIVTDDAELPEGTDKLVYPHAGSVWSTDYYPALAGRKVTIKQNDDVDLGDVPLQIRFHPILLRLLDEKGSPLFAEKDESPSFWFRVRDPRGDVVSESNYAKNALRKSESAVSIALPEGKWFLEVAAMSNDKGEPPHATLMLEVLPSDGTKQVTLNLSSGQPPIAPAASKLQPEEARRELARLGFAFTEESFLRRVESGNQAAVELFLTAGMSANAHGGNDWTALIATADRGHADILRSLLSRNADVNARTADGTTALMVASLRNDASIVKAIVDSGADLNSKTDEGWTALLLAAANGRDQIVDVLLAAGADVNLKDKNGNTALMLVSEAGDAEIMQALLNKGAQVNAANAKGQTALILAMLNEGSFPGMKLLLERGADVNARDKTGATALTHAATRKDKNFVRLLLEVGAKK